jgi:hypothetical protein
MLEDAKPSTTINSGAVGCFFRLRNAFRVADYTKEKKNIHFDRQGQVGINRIRTNLDGE